MKIKVLVGLLFLFLFLAIALTTAMVGTQDVYQVSNGKIISFNQMISDVRKADFIVVGEVHDDPDNHRLELEIIKALHETDVPIAIGLEMFRADSQRVLDDWVRGTLPLDDFLPYYYNNWRMAWPLYREIFTYAREHRIPMVGLNIPDEIAASVAKKGFASLTEKERRMLPPGISCDVDPTYMNFIRKAYAGHSQNADKQFLNFCEAQMVWDKSMAANLIDYRKLHPSQTVVVLAGVGHAWKRGIPEQLTRDSKYTVKTALPLVPGQIEKDAVTVHDADYVLLN
ncbi:MAG TPA: ChaN family lipoprotein [Nitrospirota bacterium]|nr:ChaN family lipoprotein [Nitrospirota bacterium]